MSSQPISSTAAPRRAPALPLHIVLNAVSGSGDARQSRRIIEELLAAAGRRFRVWSVEDPRRLDVIARHAVECAIRDQGAIVAAGGDGTINAVARAAVPTGRPFGIIPQGTFNYSSRAHGIPLDPAEATRALLTARIKPIQVGMVNERIFLVNASLGMYPELLEDRERYKQRFGRRRIVAFLSGVMTLLRTHRQLALEIECEQTRELVRTPTLFVGNNPLQLEQAGLPEAKAVEQRHLAAVIVKPVTNLTMVWLALRGALGQLGNEERVRDFAFRRMVVKSPSGFGGRQVKVATDGEICRMTLPLEFKVAEQPLRLLVPNEPA